MLVVFADKALEKLVRDRRKMLKKYGSIMSHKIITRLAMLHASDNLMILKGLPGNFHELKGDRAGQWACDLKQPFRLVFRPVPAANNEQCVEIVEIVDYH